MLANGRFGGTIGGKKLSDYKKMIDWDIDNEDKRLKLIEDIFNLDNIGSLEEFWQEVWDCGICKTNLSKTDARWEETDVAKFLDIVGSYLLYGYQKKKKRNKDLELFESISYDDVTNDKNYRLAPPNKIEKSDYEVRELFRSTYEDYVEKVKDKGYEIKEKESWERIKHNEEEKVKLLKEAKYNLDILKEQMEELKQGNRLQYNKEILIKTSNENIEIKLSKQLERYGLSNKEVLEIENKTSKDKYRTTNVMLWHLQSNLKDMKDYMISCKLSYTNRVMINPPKCSTNNNLLDKVNYLDSTHIRGLLNLGEMKLDPSKNIAIIANDINKKIKEMHLNGELSDRDIYIIEGVKYNVSLKVLGKELGITGDAVDKTLNRICDNIVKSFYEEHMDLYFLNVSKGTYKTCNRCGKIKLTNQFDKNGKKGLLSICKKCRKG